MSRTGAPPSIGRYQIVRELGRGAMSVVYEGLDPLIKRRVAIKTMRRDIAHDASRADELMQRFLREARAAGSLTHPGIVTIYDAGEENGTAYIAMEFIENGTLQDFLAKKRHLDVREVVSIGAQICTALAVAHCHGIVHRDVKPANIMMMPDGTVKAADFGIAHVSDSDLTPEGVMVGTPHYMSPEQFQGKAVDGRSDLFSAGEIVYEMLTGEKPFSGEGASAVMHRVLYVDPVEPKKLNFAVPDSLNEVVLKALSKNPNKRYQDGWVMTAALRHSLKATLDTAITGVGAPVPISEATTVARQQDAAVTHSKWLLEAMPPPPLVFEKILARNKPLNWRGTGWGDAITLLDYPGEDSGWSLADVSATFRGSETNVFDPGDNLVAQYNAYLSQNEQAILRSGGDNAMVMLAERPVALSDQPLQLDLQLLRTSYSMVHFYANRIAKKEEFQNERNRCLSKLIEEYQVLFAHSLCLHLVVLTADDKILITRRLPRGMDYNVGKWSASIEEQMNAKKDFDGKTPPVVALGKRALSEELSIRPSEYSEASFRIASVFLESSILNISLCGFVTLTLASRDLDIILDARKHKDREFDIWTYIDMERTSLLATILQHSMREYHPTSIYRLLKLFEKNYGSPTDEDLAKLGEYYRQRMDRV